MKVHSFLLLAYLVALVAFAASQGINNGGNSGNNNVGKPMTLGMQSPLCFGQCVDFRRGAAACMHCQPWRSPTCEFAESFRTVVLPNISAMSIDLAAL